MYRFGKGLSEVMQTDADHFGYDSDFWARLVFIKNSVVRKFYKETNGQLSSFYVKITILWSYIKVF